MQIAAAAAQQQQATNYSVGVNTLAGGAPTGPTLVSIQNTNQIFSKGRGYIPLYCGLCRSYDCQCHYASYQSNAIATQAQLGATTTATTVTTTSTTLQTNTVTAGGVINKISPTQQQPQQQQQQAYLPSPSTTPTMQQQQQQHILYAQPQQQQQQQQYNQQITNQVNTQQQNIQAGAPVNLIQNFKIPYNQQLSNEQQQQQQQQAVAAQQSYQFNLAPNLYAAAPNYQAYFTTINQRQQPPPNHHITQNQPPNALYYQQPNGTYQIIMPTTYTAQQQTNDGQQQIQIQTLPPHAAYIQHQQQPHHMLPAVAAQVAASPYHMHPYTTKLSLQNISPLNNDTVVSSDPDNSSSNNNNNNNNADNAESNSNDSVNKATNDMNENIKNFFMNVNQQQQPVVPQTQQQPTTEAHNLTRRSYSDNQIIDTRYPLNQVDNAILVQSTQIPPLPQTIIQQQVAQPMTQQQKDPMKHDNTNNNNSNRQQQQQYQTNYLQNTLNTRKEHTFYDLQNAQAHPAFYLATNTGYNIVPSGPLKINTMNKPNK